MKIPYDVLYRIYFMIDDYPTLLNFNILDTDIVVGRGGGSQTLDAELLDAFDTLILQAYLDSGYFTVYKRKDPKTGNVKKVNFGHGGTSAKRKTMRIRKSNPKARKSFRARHNCDNPGPKTKARYWSCRKW